jgi:hypothetical protein
MKKLFDPMLSPLLISLAAYLAPLQQLLVATVLLITIDTVTGIWAALKNSEKIKSGKLGRAVSKMFVYFIAILTADLLTRNFLDGTIDITKLVTGVIGLTEALSIMENLNRITGLPIFRTIIDRIRPSSNSSDDAKK